MVALKGADIEAFVARPDPARPIVLVFGPDAGLVRERVMALLRASVDDLNDPFSLVQLNGDDLASDPARLTDEATTVPLLGGRRAIWVRAGSRNFASSVEAIVNAPIKDCRIIIEAGDLRRNAPLRTVCERGKTIVALPCYVDGERELGRLIDDEMRAAQLTLAPDARAVLISLLGGDRQASRNELAKLALYARGTETVSVDDIIAVVADAGALALDAVVDAAFAGRTGEVETQYAKARTAGTPAAAIMSAALRQVSQLHVARLGIEAGTPISAATERMGLHFRRKPLVESALKVWSADRLRRVMVQLAEAVRDSRIHGALANAIAERALLSIAVSARRKN